MSLGGQNSEGSNAGSIYVQFNQDCTSLVAGSSSGYHLFALTPDDGIEEIYASRSGLETCLVDRLFSSSLVAVVTISATRKLIVCHYKKGTEICNYSYSNTILAVKLNRSRLIVCLEESLHIHNIRDMKILHTIRDTPPNPRGLCALSPCVEHCYVAYPGSSAVGEVQIFDAVHLNAKCVISAHDSPLAALAWSHVRAAPRHGVGTWHSHPRDGSTQAADEAAAPTEEDAPATWMGWLSSAVSAGAGYLPAQVADVLAQGRAFAAARLPVTGHRAVAAITNVARSARLLVATSAGALYVYALDPAEGGDCTLLRTHWLLDPRAATPHEAAELSTSNSYAGALRGRDPTRMTGTALSHPLPPCPSPTYVAPGPAGPQWPVPSPGGPARAPRGPPCPSERGCGLRRVSWQETASGARGPAAGRPRSSVDRRRSHSIRSPRLGLGPAPTLIVHARDRLAPAGARAEPRLGERVGRRLTPALSQTRSARRSSARRWRRRRRAAPSTCATPSTSRRCAPPPPPRTRPPPPPPPPPPTCSAAGLRRDCSAALCGRRDRTPKRSESENVNLYCKYLYRKSNAVVRRAVWVPRAPRLVGGAGAAILPAAPSRRVPGLAVDT
ncbi:unnamed protein product [Arctia plantaginis]|uniref:WD repeat domain phosphoinositide-interacting protein 2 n=1 Tax=Arctia plantaginis TaxID=874455 RepID=A0A8S1A0C6_ARCPL|nr:unnamed protein product [Arctia plantaginis]